MLTPKATAISAIAVAIGLVAAPTAGAEHAAGAPYDGDTVIVKYRDGVDPAERAPLAERAGVARTVEVLGAIDAQVARVDGDPVAVAERLERSPKVAYAEPNFRVHAAERPDDARFDQLWGLHNTGQGGGLRDADIDAPAGWAAAGLTGFPGTGGVPVGIVDTGVDLTHPELQGRVQDCGSFVRWSFVPTCADDPEPGHGTHVAGTAGAATDNGIGVAGVAFNSPLIVCRALGNAPGERPTGYVSDVVQCIKWVREEGAQVISMSFAGGRSKALHRAVKGVWSDGDGAVLVAAAGNHDSWQASHHASYPAAYRQVISVAATNRRDRAASFSNRHETVELAAPGASILSTAVGGGYDWKSGTSMATPHVAGAAAQLRTLRPNATARRIRTLLDRSADDLGPRGRDPAYGYGRVNLARAVTR